MAESTIQKYLKRKRLLNRKEIAEALTHKSACAGHYERLEFLGDSVLGLVVSEFLYKEFSGLDVGTISKIKGYLVSKEVLYRIGKENNVIKMMIVGNALRKKDLRSNKKIISDVVESLVGAVYYIKGFSEAVLFIKRIYKKYFKDIKHKKNFGDYKSDLQVKTLSDYSVLPEYNVVRSEGREHKKVFYVNVILKGRVLGKGSGKTIKEAEKDAARKAMKKLVRNLKISV